MKRIALSFVLLVALVTVACEKIDDLLTFYIDEDETFTIDSSFPIGRLVPITPFTVPTNSEETFKNNQTRAELVKDVSLNKLTLVITDPQQQNFDFLDEIELYISSENQPEVKIAFLEEVPMGATQLELKSTNAKLDEYIKGESYTIRTKAALRKPVSQDITIKADMRFKVTADPL
ncbi:hypothetical protein [Pontibacter akesuensis]|uniref:DUF1735 domain-containing protein n=1 Tax=Pontibacter akesuensis TaxID=388950 RepID=A0A1I7HSN5_9BACT|nr:hypothetical protein [Pontibacter akesuensis]GHA63295.1 hypothetical protein GCM10007389_14710 [Pontibacter akesuensis]SFU63466.1 hypothetical protein SAMN04487941_1630 [Pontibacter akesuensis]